MSFKQIIPCLDVAQGRVVKGTKFVNLRDAGDPLELAALYQREGADQLVFLDIKATAEGRQTTLEMVEGIAQQITIPFTVGGGIKNVADMKAILQAGADKVAVSSAAITNPDLITQGAEDLGSDRIMVAIDARQLAPGRWEVYSQGGRTATGLDVLTWAAKVVELGAGEILLTSMDRDGTKEGFDLDLTRSVAELVNVPVIASGGVGSLEHFAQGLSQGKAQGALAASIFHYRELSIKAVKQYLHQQGIRVKL